MEANIRNVLKGRLLGYLCYYFVHVRQASHSAHSHSESLLASLLALTWVIWFMWVATVDLKLVTFKTGCPAGPSQRRPGREVYNLAVIIPVKYTASKRGDSVSQLSPKLSWQEEQWATERLQRCAPSLLTCCSARLSRSQFFWNLDRQARFKIDGYEPLKSH